MTKHLPSSYQKKSTICLKIWGKYVKEENEQHNKVMSSEVREPTVGLHGVGGNQAKPLARAAQFDRWRERHRDSRRGTHEVQAGRRRMSVSPEAGQGWPSRAVGMAKLDRGLESV